jgi:hypothetical protein
MPEVREGLSWVPLKLKPSLNGQQLSVATGFFYEHHERSFLITNYHVVSGRHPDTGTCLDPMAHCPDALVLGVPERPDKDAQVVQWRWRTLQLYTAETEEARPKPVWTEHPDYGRRVDIVAIPLSGLDDTLIRPANHPKLGLERLRVYPGMDAFVLGYPRGMSGGGHLPIWKRATIATEPDFDLDGLPRFYIDTATREGMSGAPVYAQEVGFWMPEGETDMAKATLGKGCRFVGVYSGRLNAEDEFKAQLGIVWKESALIKLVESVPAELDDDLAEALAERR